MTPTEAYAVDTLPSHLPAEHERADLDLLLLGALAPTDGFEGPDGLVTLEVPEGVGAAALAAGGLALIDPEGARQALLAPRTTVPTGPDSCVLVGTVQPLPYDGTAPFAALRRSPHEVRATRGEDYLLVPVVRPLGRDDLATIRERAGAGGVVLLVMYGVEPTPGGTTALVQAALAAADELVDAEVVVAPVAARGRGTDELVRRVVAGYAVGPVLSPAGRGPAADPAPGGRGLVLFFTGLSGSGKSTVARAVQDVILQRHDRPVTSLDGDVVRRHLSEGLGFSPEDRDRNVRRIGWVAAEIARHGGLAVASPIAPFDATRRHVRRLVEEAGGDLVLVHVATPLEECERRDRKGLYAQARAGRIPDFTGISSPYEEPDDAEVRIDTTGLSVDEAADAVLTHLTRRGHLAPTGMVQTRAVRSATPPMAESTEEST